MKQVPIKVIPVDGIDLDTSPQRMLETKAVFVKGLTLTSHKNENLNNGTGEGGNYTAETPLEGNVLLDSMPILPAGKNICIGSFYSRETYETYIFVHNENEDHCIYGYGQYTLPHIVYKGADLNFSLNPELYISKGRCVLETRYFTDISDFASPKMYKFLIFTDGFNPQRFIEVESSSATNYYDITLPYFDNVANYDRSKLINLGVPTPSRCISVEPIARTEADLFKQNQLVDRMWQWRIRFITRYGQVSEYGIISNQWTSVTGGGCIASSDGLPRCVKLFIEAGGPLVEKIEIYFRINLGDWKKYDTIEKYDNSVTGPWYERALNPDLLNYNAGSNTFEYIFCADKQWDLVDQEEANRIENYLPIRSNALFSLDLSLVLVNNDRGFDPIPKTELEKVDIIVDDPSGGCSTNRKVVVYAFILHHAGWTVGDNLGDCMGLVSQAYQPTTAPMTPSFGGPGIWWGKNIYSGPGGGIAVDSSTYFGQFFRFENTLFPNAPKNFTGFMAGTPYHTEAVQYIRDGNNECMVGPWNYAVPPTSCNAQVPSGVYLQRFEFDLAPGVYAFRLGSHLCIPESDMKYQETSTYVWGTALMGNLNAANLGAPFAGFASTEKEIIIDCTAGDVILNQANDKCLVVLDLGNVEVPGTTGPGTSMVYDGYLREDVIGKLPLERMLISGTNPSVTRIVKHTDHNGYWFGAWTASPAGDPTLTTLGPTTNKPTALVDDCTTTHNKDLTGFAALDSNGDQYSAGGFWFQLASSIFSGDDEFPDTGRTHVRGGIYLCGGETVGVVNQPVFVEGATYDISNTMGIYDIIIHKWSGDYAASPVLIHISHNGVCLLTSCADPCDYSIPSYSYPQLACGAGTNAPCNPITTQRTICVDATSVGMVGVNNAGPQNGGIYQVCINTYDWVGRRRFAQTLDKFRFSIKSISETQVYGFSTIRFVMDPSILFPSDVEYITFGITPNLNFSDFLQWPADQFQFIDETGETNNANPTHIRIYIGSLNEYNKNFYFGTNTNWQFIPKEGVVGIGVLGDQVEFIQKGDGTWFDSRIICPVQYDKSGQFFTIPYRDELLPLMDTSVGPKTILKFIRPKDLQENAPFFEVCGRIKVVNGVPETFTGIIPAVDSYIYGRRIPVPKAFTNVDGTYITYPTTNNTDNPLNANNVIRFFDENNPQVNDATPFPAVFEHNSPSDFWGTKVSNRGRVNVINPQEEIKRLDNAVIVSKAFADNSVFNGLSYFSEPDEFFFNQEDLGGITAVIRVLNRLLFICRNGNFVVGYRESGLRKGEGDFLVASESIGNFSIPQKLKGGEYGCQQYFANTIQEHEGIVYWMDAAKQALVQSDFDGAMDVSIPNGYKSYMNKKIERHNQVKAILNTVNPIFFGGINPRTKEYVLSYNQIPKGPGTYPSYINAAAELNYNDANDTLIIDLRRGNLKSFAPYTPEYYSMIESANGQFISLRHGETWTHTNALGNIFNNFFGVQTKKYLEVIYNGGTEKIKRALWTEVYCKEHMFVVDRIVTETGQLSKIPAPYWRKGENIYMAAFLCDRNTVFQPADQASMIPKALVAGDALSGRWFKVRYTSLNADDAKYCELTSLFAYVLEIDKSSQ